MFKVAEMVKIILPGSNKRQEPPQILEGQHQKRRKMDHGYKVECAKILKTLMTHKFGPIFNEPVDPVELGIPDYFTIISHPMDLGTICKKLDDDIYSSTEAFAADIRLTFANAMRYNPPKNIVHLMAKELNNLFDRFWRAFEAKMMKQSKNIAEQVRSKKNPPQTSKSCTSLRAKTSESKPVKKQGVNVKAKKTEDTSKITTCSEVKPSPSISFEEKLRLKKELMAALKGDLSGPLRGFLRKYGLIYSGTEKIENVFDSFGDDTLSELKRVMKGSLGTTTQEVKDNCVKTQRTMEITERRKLEVAEKSNIESRIKAARAAKEALVESAKSDLQMRRERERERVEKMTRTVIMDDNLAVLRELEKLCQYSGIKSPLEKLGLRLKEEYYYGYEYMDDDDNGVILDELEDGEIF